MNNVATRTDNLPAAAERKPRVPMVTRPIVMAAIRDSFRKLHPRVQVRNPVMFVVYVGSILTTGLGIAAARRQVAERRRSGVHFRHRSMAVAYSAVCKLR